MTKRLPSPSAQDRQGSSRLRGSGLTLALAGLASLALLLSACGSGSASATSTTASAGTGHSNTGAGAVTRPGSNAGSGSSGIETAGSYGVVFADCMRTHGVPKFPNPNGSGGILGPDSGVNPASPAFRAALNGPCQSLAPAGWASSGPITK
jgi:hypothetical protein